MEKHKKIKAISNNSKLPASDIIISSIIFFIYTSLIVFAIISSANPRWLHQISREDKWRELSSEVNNGIHYSQQGQDKKAIEIYKNVLKKLPDMVEAYINLGVSYKRIGQYDKALETFDKALTYCPEDSSNIYLNIMDVYNYLNDDVKTREFFNLAMETNHFVIDMYMKKGDYHLYNENWDTSLIELNKALEYRYEMKSYYDDMLYDAYFRNKEKPEIIKPIQKIFKKGITNIDFKKYDMDAFLLMVNSDNGLAINYNKIGFVLAKKSDYKKAAEYFQKALDIWPEYEDAYANLKYVSSILNN